MKIILSRKGFDSANGEQPNPIMPDRSLLALPIPDKKYGNNTYASLEWDGMSYYDIIRELKPNTKLNAEDYCHLDPDLREGVKKRLPGWKPAFGQSDKALKHLQKNGVKEGDLFLFFGWFRQTERINGKLVYKRDAKDLHIIYAYMQIGEIIKPMDNPYDWLKEHPHIGDKKQRNNDSDAIFLPSDILDALPSLSGYKGCDVLTYRDDRVLTNIEKYTSRRYWKMPDCFKKVNITYHPNPWENGYFKSAGRGQEFVIDATPEIQEWAKQIIKKD